MTGELGLTDQMTEDALKQHIFATQDRMAKTPT